MAEDRDDAFDAYDRHVAEMSAGDPVAARRRALADRVTAMDAVGLAAMERAADLIAPGGADYGFTHAPVVVVETPISDGSVFHDAADKLTA